MLDKQYHDLLIKNSRKLGVIRFSRKGWEMVFPRRLLTAVLVLACISFIQAQDWGLMQIVWWEPWPDPFGSPGVFNPSYCGADSTLYFDGYLRFGYYNGAGIWISKFDSLDQYGSRRWSDPEPLPEPINTPQQPQTINAMAAISNSGDSLFFCSDRPGSFGGLDIWLSIRQGETWSEPINLGDSVNSEMDEESPHYASAINTLFFDRLEQRINYHFALYKSAYLGDSVWQTGERLPEIINPIDYGGYGPSYDETNSDLYFNLGYFGHDICVSRYSDGEWSEPAVLSDNVNGLYAPNIYDWVSTREACISADGQLLFYNKDIWEFNCIDFTSFLFFSERLPDAIEADPTTDARDISFRIYPNPSNSKFSLEARSTDSPSSLTIYNVLGQTIKTYSVPKNMIIVWDGTDENHKPMPSGLYFARLKSGQEVTSKKLIMLR